MGNCSNTKKRIPLPPRKGNSSSKKKIILVENGNEVNKFKRSLSKEESLTSNKNNINNYIKDNNNNKENISSNSKSKIILIKFNKNNKCYNNGGLIKSKSKEKVVNTLKNYQTNNTNKRNSCAKIKYIHLKNRSCSSSKYDLLSLNSSINNTHILEDKTNGKAITSKGNKSGCKCKNKNRIPRSTFDSNNSNFSSSTRNCKIKTNKFNYNTMSLLNDENIDIINKNIFNIYNNNTNTNINSYQNKNNNLENNNKEMYKCIKTIEGHQEKIVSMIELSCGLIATGSYDCKIKIWDLENNLCIKTINENGYIFCLLEMEKNMLLCGTNNNSIQLYDIISTSNDMIFSFRGHDLWVNCLIKCDSQFFASGSNDAEIRIWDYNNKSLYKVIRGHDDCILSMILLKNGKLCSGSADLTIKIWDWRNGECINTLTGHEKWVKCLCQLNDDYIISGADDMVIKIWKENECIKEFMGHNHSVRTLCKISDDEFASGSFDGTIKIWNINSFEAIQTLLGHQSYVISVIKISNGDLVSCSNDHSIKIWRK